jgi:hypothetical protein
MATDPTPRGILALALTTPGSARDHAVAASSGACHCEGPEPYSVPRSSPRTANYRDLCMIYEGSHEQLPVHAPDLSTSGLFINTSRYFPQGAVLNLSFRLARSGREVKARGEVRYCMPGVGIGVEFVEISAEDRQAIEADGK